MNKPSVDVTPIKNRLTQKQLTFCREYATTGNARQSAIKAGYSLSSSGSAANTLLRQRKVRDEINRIMEQSTDEAIMSGKQVMELFTQIARGEVKDQFGLDASLSDRIKALQEIAKRTIDIENKSAGAADMNVSINLDWHRD